MRPLSVRHCAFVAAALAGALLFAGPAPAKAKAKAAASPYAAEVKELHEIKVLLERADRDYKGHRAEAVKQIGEAIHALHPGHKHHAGKGGKGVKGGGEAQPVSDAQLRESVKALRAVHEQLVATGGAPAVKAAEHVHKASKDLEIALKVK